RTVAWAAVRSPRPALLARALGRIATLALRVWSPYPLRRYAERLQVLHPIALRDRVRNIGDALRRLPYRNRIDHLVFQRVDRCSAIGIFESYVDPRAVAGRP